MADSLARRQVAPQAITAARTQARLSTAHLSGAAALGLAAIGLWLRLYQIDNQSLWLDEGYTLLFSRMPLDRLFLVGGAHEHPPLYYLIVHTILQFWDSALVPRIVSAIAGSISILVLYALGARILGRVAGLVAAGLLATSPFHVWYGQDGRAYELAGLLVLVSYFLLIKAIEAQRRSLWLTYGVVVALSLYSEYTTIFVLMPQALFLVRAHRAGLQWSLVRSWALAAILFAPWIGTVVLDAKTIAGNYWIPPPSFSGLTGTTLQFLGLRTPCPSPPCVGSEAHIPFLVGHEAVVSSVVIGLAVLVLLGALTRKHHELLVLALWLVLPFVLILVIAVHRSLYLDRVFLDATFPLYLMLGALAAWLAGRRSRWIGAVGLLVILGTFNFANLRAVYADPSNPDWRTAARDLQTAYRPGQAVVFNPGVLRTLIATYLPPKWHATLEGPIWYHTYLDVPAWQDRYRNLVSQYLDQKDVDLQTRYVALDTALRDRELSVVAARARQIWLVTQDYPGFNETRRWFLEHGYTLLLSETYFKDSRLELWDRGTPQEFGYALMPETRFDRSWTLDTHAQRSGATLLQNGGDSASRSFSLRAGHAYVANVEYQAFPPANPSVMVHVYDRSGHVLGGTVDRFGNYLDSFPRTEWYDLPANGVWLSQPFGFVAPPGSVRATITLRNGWGQVYWRHIAIYGER